jgi:hypothetical protein
VRHSSALRRWVADSTRPGAAGRRYRPRAVTTLLQAGLSWCRNTKAMIPHEKRAVEMTALLVPFPTV